MEIRKLEVFCKVVELKSFTQAAEVVLLSQPTVSEHIRNLESELGQKLIDRLGKEIEPTAAGRLLYSYAVQILMTRQKAIQAIEQFSGRLAGKIMIGCGTIPGTYILPRHIGQFRRKYPDIKATLRIGSSKIIVNKVQAGEYELGIVGARWNQPSLEWHQLFSDTLALAVHPKHPWADRQSVTLAEVIKEPIITREVGSGTRKVIAGILEKNGFREGDLEEACEIGSTAGVKEAVKAGIGVAIISTSAVADDVQCGKISQVFLEDLHAKRSFYLVKRKNRELSPVASVFIKYLQEKAPRPK